MNDKQIYIMVDAFREENRWPTREALHDFVLDIIGDGKPLRDEFAMAALMACRNHSNEQWLAERAYKIADAMLKARNL